LTAAPQNPVSWQAFFLILKGGSHPLLHRLAHHMELSIFPGYSADICVRGVADGIVFPLAARLSFTISAERLTRSWLNREKTKTRKSAVPGNRN